ncbi:MAG: cohesin domain-containing protein [Clostridia bacterium]|nr:cohesin domain-containing protein [Clostridia bacterium]
MKFKKITALLTTSMLTLSCIASVKAADVQVPIEFDTALSSTISGYCAEITYNPEQVSPLLISSDVLGEDCYAENAVGRGYLTADKVEDGKIVIGWADREHYDMSEYGNILANINFTVLDDTATEITVETKFYQVARYPDIMLDSEYNCTVAVQLPAVNTDADEIISSSAVEIN